MSLTFPGWWGCWSIRIQMYLVYYIVLFYFLVQLELWTLHCTSKSSLNWWRQILLNHQVYREDKEERYAPKRCTRTALTNCLSHPSHIILKKQGNNDPLFPWRIHLLDSILSKMQSDVKPGRNTAGGHCFTTSSISPCLSWLLTVELSYQLELSWSSSLV